MSMFERVALRGGGLVKVSVTEETSDSTAGAIDPRNDWPHSVFKLRDGTVLDKLGDAQLQDPRNGERYELIM
jgi:hypothetical protein